MSGRSIPNISGKGWGFPGIGPPPTFGPFMVGLRTVLALVGVSFSMLMYYNEPIMRLKVPWKSNLPPILDLVGSNQFLSCPMAMSFF